MILLSLRGHREVGSVCKDSLLSSPTATGTNGYSQIKNNNNFKRSVVMLRGKRKSLLSQPFNLSLMPSLVDYDREPVDKLEICFAEFWSSITMLTR